MRNYKRKSNQNAWSEQAMKGAIRAVRAGEMTQNAAAVHYQVPVATLNRRIKSGKGEDDGSKKKLGRFSTIFTPVQENDLCHHILQLEKTFFGLSTYEVRSLAYQYATRNNIENNFNRQTKLAGLDWMYGFLKRHKQISLRKPENTSAARAAGFNRVSVETFFNLLGSLIDKYHFPPSRIYNCDETGITTVPNKPSKIFSLKGKKQVGCYTSAERGTTITAEICVSATGHYVPPMLVIPRIRRNPIYEIGLPAESVVAYHSSGWMQSEIFSDIWFPHFLRHTHPSEESPVLLILDGHVTHVKNIRLIEQARQNHVVILAIPPHTSHRLQPLDVAFMYPLSNYYSQELKTWQRNKPNKLVELADVSQIFGKAYVRAATLTNAKNGFEGAGIYPYNPNKFPDDLFAPAELTERDISPTTALGARENNADPDPVTEDPAQETRASTPLSSSCNTIATVDLPGCSHWSGGNTPPKNQKNIFEEKQQKTPPQARSDPDDQLSDKDATSFVSPEQILPLPKVIPKQVNRGTRRKGKTAVITSSPYFQELKELKRPQVTTTEQAKQAKRKLVPSAKVPKLPKRKVAKLSESEDSDDVEEQVVYEDESDNSDFVNHSDEETLTQEKSFSLVKGEIRMNDFVLVTLREEKTQANKKYVAQIIDIHPQEQEGSYTAKFMRNYRGHDDIFVFPEAEDQSLIYNSEILGVLQNFSTLRYGKVKFM